MQLLWEQDCYFFLQVLQFYVRQFDQLVVINYNKYFDQVEVIEDELIDFKEDMLDFIKFFMAGQQCKIFDDIIFFLERGQANNQYIDQEELQALRMVVGESCFYVG